MFTYTLTLSIHRKQESMVAGILFAVVLVVTSAMPEQVSSDNTEAVVGIHVAPNGNDTNPGTAESPLLTLQRARNAIRTLKSEGRLTGPVEIILHQGTYYIDETLVLEPQDSGTRERPITWRAAQGETVVLSGGRRISGVWKTDDGKIWHTGIPDTRGWQGDRDAPEVYSPKPTGPWHFRQLFVNGRRATRARYPNAGAQNPFLYAAGGTLDHVELPKGQVKADWRDEPDAQINVVPEWRFFNQWNDVVGVDPGNSILHLGRRERHGKIIPDSWFWIEGVFSELDQPGEWYLDPVEGRLFYMPEGERNPNDLEIVAPCLNRIVYLRGDVEKGTQVEYVCFKGLEFRNTTFTLGHIEARVHTDAAVMLENASSCRVEECHFENIGGYALWLHLDSRSNVIDGNRVLDSGGGGVLMTGSRLSYMDDTKVYTPGTAAARVAPILNEITQNTVRHCGKIRYYGGGVHMDSRPASMAMMPGNYIAHNHFQDLSRNGIFAFRNQGGNVVEYNLIHDCMQTTIDGAGIHFATMNHLNAPNYILSNYLYDIWGFEQMPGGNPKRKLANGVYLDWDTSNTTVMHNYIYNAGGQPVKIIWKNRGLSVDDNYSDKKWIEPPFLNEIGPWGTVTHGIRPANLKRTGRVLDYMEKEFVTVEGDWQPETVGGMNALFRFSFIKARPDAFARAVFRLPIEEPGSYLLCLCYKPDKNNASNARLKVTYAGGEDIRTWDMRQGNEHGFAVEVGSYRFTPKEPALLTISNEGADGFVVLDSVAFMRE